MKKQKKPDKIWSGRGKEFYNKTFLDFLKSKTFEFFQLIQISKLFLLNDSIEPMYIKGKACWLNHLDNALENYNTRVDGTLKMTLFETVTNAIKPIRNTIPNVNKNCLISKWAIL